MEKIKKIIIEELEKRGAKILKMYLFGSRSKGIWRESSDWDIFVIIDKKMSFNEKWDIIDQIKIRLAKINVPNDIILKSEEEVEKAKNDVGRITYYVLKEGVEI